MPSPHGNSTGVREPSRSSMSLKPLSASTISGTWTSLSPSSRASPSSTWRLIA